MKYFIGSVLWFSGLHLVSPAAVAPYTVGDLKTVNTSDNKFTARGSDPSRNYQNKATVEIWSSVHAVNWGNARDGDIYNTVVGKLRELCPYNEHESRDCPGSSSTYDTPTDWASWDTKALVDDSHAESKKAWLRIESGQAFNGEVYELLLDLAASTLKAFVSQDHNCADVSGTTYCNVPDAVRINLPQTEWNHDRYNNHLHIETWHVGKLPLPWTKGILYPCRTRHDVDEVMDSKQDRLEKLFPKWEGKFHREAWVIIDCWQSCKDGTP